MLLTNNIWFPLMANLFGAKKQTQIIEIYEGYPILYRTNDPEYHNKTKRQDALASIQREMISRSLTANQCLTVNDIKQKWHGLRSQYFREIGKINQSRHSGVGEDDGYKLKLWCFHHLEVPTKHGSCAAVPIKS